MGVFLLTLALVAIGASWVLTHQQPEKSVSAVHPEAKTAISERTTPSNTKPAVSLPADDVPGKDVPALPRYPGSVRVEYERKEQDLLVFTRVRYLSHARLDVIRGFYRGVFRAEGWKVVNVEFTEGEWTFLVAHGEREANVIIEPHGQDVARVYIEFSEPLSEKEPAPKQRPQKREDDPAPQSVTPAPDPQPTLDDYEDGGDDLGDDGGGDD